jgi:hypothetical protein
MNITELERALRQLRLGGIPEVPLGMMIHPPDSGGLRNTAMCKNAFGW